MKRLSATLLILSTFVMPAGLAQTPAMTDTQAMEYEDEEEEIVTQEEAVEDMKTRLRKAQEVETAPALTTHYSSQETNIPAPDQPQAEPVIAPAASTAPGAGTVAAVAPAEDPARAVTAKPKPAAAAVIEKKSSVKQKHDWSFKDRKTSKTSAAEPTTTSSGMKKY
jgi:hypothetical protein